MSTKEPFFAHDNARAKLIVVAESWIRTPFIAHARKKRNGVDCVHLCAEIFRECGLFADYKFPNYTIQGGHHCEKSKIGEWLKTSSHFTELNAQTLELKTLQPGDLLLFNFAKSAWHIGVLVNADTFVHCMIKGGVMFSAIRDPRFCKNISAVYRPVN